MIFFYVIKTPQSALSRKRSFFPKCLHSLGLEPMTSCESGARSTDCAKAAHFEPKFFMRFKVFLIVFATFFKLSICLDVEWLSDENAYFPIINFTWFLIFGFQIETGGILSWSVKVNKLGLFSIINDCFEWNRFDRKNFERIKSKVFQISVFV